MVDIYEVNLGTKLTFKDGVRSFGKDYSGKTMKVSRITFNQTKPDESTVTLYEDENNLHWFIRVFERIEPDVSLLDVLTEINV